MTYAQAKKTLDRNSLKPLYIITGSEDYFVRDIERTIVSCALNEADRAFNCDVYDGERLSASQLFAASRAMPMSGDYKVVIVRDFESVKLSADEAERIFSVVDVKLERGTPSTVLILEANELDARSKAGPALKRRAVHIECSFPEESELSAWLTESFGVRGKSIAPRATELMKELLAPSLQTYATEMEKLIAVAGDREEIVEEDVLASVGMTREFSVFELTKAVGERDAKAALKILDRLLETGQRPQLLITMLTRFFGQLWRFDGIQRNAVRDKIGSFEVARMLGTYPAYMMELRNARSNFTRNEIETGIRSLLSADIESKSRPTDSYTVMSLLLHALVTGTNLDDQLRSIYAE